jgi:hypothetical protein
VSLRALFAIQRSSDWRTAVHRRVTTKADYLSAHGHDADVLSADDVRPTRYGVSAVRLGVL